MKKFTFLLAVFALFILSGCSKEEVKTTFKIHLDDYYIYDDSVIMQYITDENGVLETIDIDRLLPLEDIFYAYSFSHHEELALYNREEIFEKTTSICSTYGEVEVPKNISVGITRYRYNSKTCSYQEVDRNNEYRSGQFMRKYNLIDTVPVSPNTDVKILIYKSDELEKFKEIMSINYTVKSIGLLSKTISDDYTNYTHDIRLFEEFLLKYQNNVTAVDRIKGISENVNLFNMENALNIKPLIENFDTLYEKEVKAIKALYEMIVVVQETTETTTTNTDTTQDDINKLNLGGTK